MENFHPTSEVEIFLVPTEEQINSIVVRDTVMACTLRRRHFIVIDEIDCKIIDIYSLGSQPHSVTRSPKLIIRARDRAGENHEKLFRSNHMVEIPTPAKTTPEQSQYSAKSLQATKPMEIPAFQQELAIRNADSSLNPVYITGDYHVPPNTPVTPTIQPMESIEQVGISLDLPPPSASLAAPSKSTQTDKGYDADIETSTETEEADDISFLDFDTEEDDYGFTMIKDTHAETTSKLASELRSCDFIMIDNRLCIIKSVTEIPGKKRGASPMLSILARGWFNEDRFRKTLVLAPDAKVAAPIVTHTEMALLDIDENGTLSLIDGDGAVEEGVQPLS